MLFASAFIALCFVALPIWFARRHIAKGGNDPLGTAFVAVIIAAAIPTVGVIWLESTGRGTGLDWPVLLAYCLFGAIALVGANKAKKEAEEVRSTPVVEAAAMPEPASVEVPPAVVEAPVETAPAPILAEVLLEATSAPVPSTTANNRFPWPQPQPHP